LLLALSLAARAQPPTLPAQWAGAQVRGGRIAVTIAESTATPRVVVAESAPKRGGYSVDVTDIAIDAGREVIYVGTCCEPGSGQLRRVDLRAPTLALLSDDQGFRVDAAGDTSTVARTDTAGTLAIRRSPAGKQEVRAQIGVSDVAVDATDGAQVIALIQTARLRAVIPTVARRDPALLVLRWQADRWSDVGYPLTGDATYCAAVALGRGAIGLLAGQVDPANPVACVGDRLDIYNLATRQLRSAAITFPAKVRHLSVDGTSTFLIFTTVDGAVRWQTLAGESGLLAPRGFVAADW
jgi:hypothetical protein